MPTYAYFCACGIEFEDFQPMPGKQRMKCPECARDATKKISGGAGIIFKGAGFYCNDYPRQP